MICFSNRAHNRNYWQKLSPFLNNFGEENDYLILRTTPVNCLEENQDCRYLALKPELTQTRNKIIERIMKNNDIKIIFTLGRSAQEIGKNLNKFGAPLVHLNKENIDKDYLQEKFYSALEKYIGANSLHRPRYNYRLSDEYIPRKDLPFMTRWWMGTSGRVCFAGKRKVSQRG